MHSPDPKAHIVKKTTNLNDKKKNMADHLFRGSVISNTPKSASGGSRLVTNTSDLKSANRFEEHSQSFSKFSSHLEIQIKHESSSRPTLSIAGELASPRSAGNPILQGGDEKVHQWKPLAKRHGNSYKTSIFSEEAVEKPRGMAKGIFSDEARKNADEVPEKKTGIRSIPQKDTIHLDQSPKRQLKVVHSSPEKARPNPITEGEAEAPIRTRVTEQQVSDWTKKSNTKGAFLPCERNDKQDSPRRVRLEKPSEVKSLFESSPTTKPSAPQMSDALKAKQSGTVGSLFSHSHYDDSKLKVTAKCGEVDYATIKSNLNVEKTYSRVKGDIHI